jgi:hypothetical protein
LAIRKSRGIAGDCDTRLMEFRAIRDEIDCKIRWWLAEVEPPQGA